MADTVRKLSDIAALLANNTGQAIGAQDLRDLMQSALGFLYGRALSGSTTLTTDDIVVAVTTAASAITVGLPQASTCQYKVYCLIKVDAGAGTVIIDPYSTELINGAATYTLTPQWAAAIVWNSGTQWFVLATK